MEPMTLFDLLRRQAAGRPEQRAFTFLVDGESESGALTYRQLETQARAIGGWLQQQNAAGERVLLPYPPGLEFIAAFFGCLYAGAVAVPVHPPARQETTPQLAAIAANAGASFLLTTAAQLSRIKSWLAENPALKQPRQFATDELDLTLADSWRPPRLSGEALALLQYTSGSTTTPKGVMLQHRHILTNLGLVIKSAGVVLEEHRGGVSWLPPYHDLGLIGMLCLAVYTGRPWALLSPTAFMQKPLRWLQAISRYQATYSAAPNFAYDLCVETVTVGQIAELDLSHWRTAVVGSEPIRPGTLARFTRSFAPCGFRPEAFYPAYGVSEATLVTTGGQQTALPRLCTVKQPALQQNRVAITGPADPEGQTFVGCGQPLHRHRVVIVDPSRLTACPPDRVGEIWIAGPSVGAGYWGQPVETAFTFEARLSNGEGPFLRTGDLGFLNENELYITGRLKDMMIFLGRNYYPQDIEQAAGASHPALRSYGGAAFSIDVAGQEQLVIVFELERRYRHADVEEVAAAIRGAVARAYGIETYAVVLIKTGHLPRTSSGKNQRYQCRAQFLAGTLPVIGASIRGRADPFEPKHAPEPAAEQRSGLETEVRARLAPFLRLPPDEIDLEQSIQRLGLGSLQVTAIKFQLEAYLGTDLPPELFLSDLTLNQFIDVMLKEADDRS